MRQWATTGGVLLAVASLTLAACGSSAKHAGSAPGTSRPPTTSASAPPTTAATTTTTLNAASADAVAQYALTASLDAAQTTYDDTYDFTAVSPASLGPTLPNVHFAPLDQASTSVVGVLAQDKNDVLFVTRSASGKWYCVTDNDEDGVSYGVGHTLDDVNSNGQCQLDAWPAPGTDG
jgi:hypothetical protein